MNIRKHVKFRGIDKHRKITCEHDVFHDPWVEIKLENRGFIKTF